MIAASRTPAAAVRAPVTRAIDPQPGGDASCGAAARERLGVLQAERLAR